MLNETQDRLLEVLEEDLSNVNNSELANLLGQMHGVDIAQCLEEMTDEEISDVFAHEDVEHKADILEQADSEQQTRILKLIDNDVIIGIFSYMSKDDIADVMGELPIGKRKNLLNQMKQSDSQEVQTLMGYEADTAGSIMTTEYIALSGRLSMEQALLKIKEIAPKTEVIEHIYIINTEKQLDGVVDLRDIFSSPKDMILEDIAEHNVISVFPEEDQEEVSHLVSKYDLPAIPVVNHKNALLGIITVDDIIDVLVEEQTEDILHLGGASTEEKIGGPIGLSIRRRLPWLVVNLVTAFFAAFTISAFESVIAQVAALASAMTIISGMGGNAGTQTMSLTLRGITLGKIDFKRNWKIVLKEIALGLVDGAVIGLITGLILSFRYGSPYLGVIVLIAMMGNLIVAGIFGFLIPIILKGVGADPALASSIFLTTATDVLGFFIFLQLAKLFLPLLV